jgi:hypothetical protein
MGAGAGAGCASGDEQVRSHGRVETRFRSRAGIKPTTSWLVVSEGAGRPADGSPDHLTRGQHQAPARLPGALVDGHELQLCTHWLGHADLSTTNRYAEINTRAKEQALLPTEPPDTSAGPRRTPIWRSDEALLNWLASL